MQQLEGLLQAKGVSLEVNERKEGHLYTCPGRKMQYDSPPPNEQTPQALHSESAASAQRLTQLQAALTAKEGECTASEKRVEDLEKQLRLLWRGREEDGEELGRLKENVGGSEKSSQGGWLGVGPPLLCLRPFFRPSCPPPPPPTYTSVCLMTKLLPHAMPRYG